jgi:hypothetical protein
MRTSLTLLLSLLLLSLASSAGRSQPRPLRGKPRAAAKAIEPPPKWEVKGLGETMEEAEKDALARARTLVEEYLRARQPPVRWSPPLAYLRDHLVVGEPQEGKPEKIVTPKRVYEMKSWTWTVSVPPDEYRQLVKEDRQARSAERMLLAGKVMGGLVLLLALTAGYLRLTEGQQGGCPRWLRLALAGAAAVGVLLLVLA